MRSRLVISNWRSLNHQHFGSKHLKSDWGSESAGDGPSPRQALLLGAAKRDVAAEEMRRCWKSN